MRNIKLNYDYSDFIFKELTKFEGHFNDYIFKQMVNNPNYLNISVPAKLSGLVKDNLIESHSKGLSILSFNYTLQEKTVKDLRLNPAGTYILSNSDELSTSLNEILNSWINIHGMAGNNSLHENPIIFGIDSNLVNKLDNDSFEYNLEVKFTKAFRVAMNNVSRSITPLPKNVDLITFYGHSLSSADFSYFESIFDTYDIYNSNLKLEFYYGTYNFLHEQAKSKFRLSNSYLAKYINEKNDQNKQNLFTNVYNLFKNYDSTVNNRHKGNLLNRLLLEGRIAFNEDCGSFTLPKYLVNDIKRLENNIKS